MAKRRKVREPLSTLPQVRRFVTGERVIIVDPGSDGTGWSLWDFSSNGTHIPIACKALKSKKLSWYDRMEDITQQFHEDVMALDAVPDRMLLEWPEIWVGSERSQASAASGDLIKLAALCGALGTVAVWCCPESSLFVSAREWKGQLSKKTVDIRIKRANGQKYPNHTSDTVGIGLAVLGLL